MAEDTLADFLADQPWKGGRSCAVCSIPPDLLAEVEAAVAGGMRRWRGIVRWLDARGVTVTAAMLQYHFDRSHEGRP